MRKLFVEKLNKLFSNKENYPNFEFERIQSKPCRTWRIKHNQHYIEFHAYFGRPEELIITCYNKYRQTYTRIVDCRFFRNKKTVEEMIINLVQTLN